MLQKPISKEQRAEEIRLLNEYVAAGKVSKIDYVEPENIDIDEDEEDEIERDTWKRFGREDLGDGNFRVAKHKGQE